MPRLITFLVCCCLMAAGQTITSKQNAEHYLWGQGCDGWYLVKNSQLNVIQERMPPGTTETLHKHDKSFQFFYMLTGSAVMEHGGLATELAAGSGLEIPPGMPHRIMNHSRQAIEFIVTSSPPSHGDRIELSSP